MSPFNLKTDRTENLNRHKSARHVPPPKDKTMKDEKTKTKLPRSWHESDADGQANRRTTLHLPLHREREV